MMQMMWLLQNALPPGSRGQAPTRGQQGSRLQRLVVRHWRQDAQQAQPASICRFPAAPPSTGLPACRSDLQHPPGMRLTFDVRQISHFRLSATGVSPCIGDNFSIPPDGRIPVTGWWRDTPSPLQPRQPLRHFCCGGTRTGHLAPARAVMANTPRNECSSPVSANSPANSVFSQCCGGESAQEAARIPKAIGKSNGRLLGQIGRRQVNVMRRAETQNGPFATLPARDPWPL